MWDFGSAECMVVPDEFNMGYQSLSEVAGSLAMFSGGMESRTVSHTVIRRENLFYRRESGNTLYHEPIGRKAGGNNMKKSSFWAAVFPAALGVLLLQAAAGQTAGFPTGYRWAWPATIRAIPLSAN